MFTYVAGLQLNYSLMHVSRQVLYHRARVPAHGELFERWTWGEATQVEGGGSRLPKSHEGLVRAEVWVSGLEGGKHRMFQKGLEAHTSSQAGMEWVLCSPFVSESQRLFPCGSFPWKELIPGHLFISSGGGASRKGTKPLAGDPGSLT